MPRLSLWLCCCVLLASVDCKPELKLLHVVFAHKLYAPFKDVSQTNVTRLPRNLTYEYFETAAVDMPNAGKLSMYKLGGYLRKTYGKFLGATYTAEVTKMRTAEYPLSILSGQLVNAGLWPPKGDQKWHDTLDWQPVPTDHTELDRDTLLMGTRCPSFREELSDVLESAETTRKRYSSLFDYLSNHTGIRIEEITDVALLYASLETKADLNQTLPKWAKDIFPHGSMYNASVETYDVLSRTPLQRRLNGGTMLKEIAGTTLRQIQGEIPGERKILLYSGNDRTIAGVLKALDTWTPHLPGEASAVIFETHRDNDTRKHYVKVKYYVASEGEAYPVKLRNCSEPCPLKSFVDAYFDVMPQRESLLCKWDLPGVYNVTYYYNITHVSQETSSGPSNSAASASTSVVLIVSLITLVTLLASKLA